MKYEERLATRFYHFKTKGKAGKRYMSWYREINLLMHHNCIKICAVFQFVSVIINGKAKKNPSVLRNP
jgi:hypothetical protein